MTMKKIALSALAATMVSTATIAGTVSTPDGGLVSEELLSFQDVDITTVTDGSKYSPDSIPATSLKNPIFKFIFANMKNLSVDANVSVYEYLDGNETNLTVGNVREVANNPQISSLPGESAKNVVSFNAINGDIYVYNGRTYALADANDTNTSGVSGQIAKGSTSDVTLAAELYSGDSQALNDSASPSRLYTIGKEFVASIATKFDARINAAKEFFTFFDHGEETSGSTSTTKDTLRVDVTHNETVAGLDTPLVNLVTFSDTNLTANAYSASATYNEDTPEDTPNDYNVTMAAAPAAAAAATASEYSVELTVDGTSKIEKTNFGAHMWITATGTTSTFDLFTSDGTNAGKWDIYGYNAQIPNVSTNGSTIDTVTTITNRSGLDAKAIFTLIDADGTVVVLSSDDYTEINAIAKNTTEKYTASVLKTLAMAKDAAFTGDAFALEISVPTTPSSVYATSSFKNMSGATPVFKDLPVYNTSTMTY